MPPRDLSTVADLEQALGQYLIYKALLAAEEPGRALFLAAPSHLYDTVWETTIGRVVTDTYGVKLLLCDVEQEVIDRWQK